MISKQRNCYLERRLHFNRGFRWLGRNRAIANATGEKYGEQANYCDGCLFHFVRFVVWNREALLAPILPRPSCFRNQQTMQSTRMFY